MRRCDRWWLFSSPRLFILPDIVSRDLRRFARWDGLGMVLEGNGSGRIPTDELALLGSKPALLLVRMRLVLRAPLRRHARPLTAMAAVVVVIAWRRPDAAVTSGLRASIGR